MAYSELLIAPMREALVVLGFEELRTPGDVDRFMAESREGLALIAVNSICGCAGGTMRPALARALSHAVRPLRLGTVFAGQDAEAVARAREYFTGYSPSSPAIAIFRNGALAMMFERPQIKAQHPTLLADELAATFRRLLGEEAAA